MHSRKKKLYLFVIYRNCNQTFYNAKFDYGVYSYSYSSNLMNHKKFYYHVWQVA